jgi:serine protease
MNDTNARRGRRSAIAGCTPTPRHHLVLASMLFIGALARAAPLASAAGSGLVGEIVVKYRDDSLPKGIASLPDAEMQALAKAIQSGFAESGRASDGSFRILLNPPLSVDAARAALNRVREDRAVMFASVAREPAPAADLRMRAKTRDLSRPTDRLIVKYRDPAMTALGLSNQALPAREVTRLGALAGMALAPVRPMADGAQVVRLLQRTPVDVVEQMAANIAAQPDVEWAQPDYIDQAMVGPNDPCYGSASVAACNGGFQWDLFDPNGGVNALAAWSITTGSANIVVSVIDTGALFNHPDLTGRFIGGYDMVYDNIGGNDNDPTGLPAICATNPLAGGCSSRDNDASDPGDWVSSAEDASGWLQGCGASNSSWHGSHVAGTIGATANNGIGIAGLNWVSKILPVRVLGKCGGYTSDIADGMTWASGGTVSGVPANPNPARVLNLSIGGYRSNKSCDPAYTTAITGALSRNTVIAIAAGNSNYDSDYSAPGNCAGVITVAATGEKGFKAYYSNWGTHVEIAAPGGDGRVQATYNPNGRVILSSLNAGTTVPGAYNYAGYQGTSMATPHVVGIASLMLSVNPSLTPAQVLSKMQTTARVFPTGAPACSTANDPVINPIPNVNWFGCTCTTSLCGAGLIDAGAAVAASVPPPTNKVPKDLNNDRFTDIIWYNATTGGTGAWLMNGNIATASSGLLTDPNWKVTLMGDFNGDGKADIIWYNAATGGTGLWIMNGLTPTYTNGLLTDPNYKAVFVGDFDNDGKDDLIWYSAASGGTSMWLMSGASAKATAPLRTSLQWKVTHVADFDGDGKADLLWYNSVTGATEIWLMNGTSIKSSAVILTDPNWKVTHVADFDKDGKADLIWYNAATGGTGMWLMNGLSAKGSGGLLTDPNWKVTFTGDFNGDGMADLIWHNAATGGTGMWLMNGLTATTTSGLMTSLVWNVVNVGDFNGDGKSDLLWRNNAAGTGIWLMNGITATTATGLLGDPLWVVQNPVP